MSFSLGIQALCPAILRFLLASRASKGAIRMAGRIFQASERSIETITKEILAQRAATPTTERRLSVRKPVKHMDITWSPRWSLSSSHAAMKTRPEREA